jgi:hypothetical protein
LVALSRNAVRFEAEDLSGMNPCWLGLYCWSVDAP